MIKTSDVCKKCSALYNEGWLTLCTYGFPCPYNGKFEWEDNEYEPKQSDNAQTRKKTRVQRRKGDGCDL